MTDSIFLRVTKLLALTAALASSVPAVAQERGGPGRQGGGPERSHSDDGPGGEGRSGRRGSGFFSSGGAGGEGARLSSPLGVTTVPFPDQEAPFSLAPAPPVEDVKLPNISNFAAPEQSVPLTRRDGAVTLSAKLTEDGGEVSRGLVWRIFSPVENAEGRLPLVASARGGTSTFDLDKGSYLVHASFGRAGATMRITVGGEKRNQALVLDAGGLKLDAVVSGNHQIAQDKVRFSIFEAEEDAAGERALIIPDVNADAIVRLNAGTYHVVSTYGDVNAVIRSDIRVEAGKLTEATVEHRAAQLTLKLVREKGGEAMADTSWSVLTDGGDLVRESVGAYATMVLAEGSYTVVAKNRDRIYQRDIAVTAGDDGEVEVLASEANLPPTGEISD